MSKKVLLGLACLLLALALHNAALAAEIYDNPPVEVYINGKLVPNTSLKPVQINSRIYVPVEALSLLRNVVAIDNEKGAGIAILDWENGGYYWVCQITRNDQPGPPPAGFKYNGKTYIPLRHWAEFVGATVGYDNGKIYVQQ